MTTDKTFDLITMADMGKPFPVNARNLHSTLGSQTKYSDWMKKRIASLTLILEQDYSLILSKGISESELVNEYWLSVKAAKRIAMVEFTSKGDEVRDYFLRMEELVKEGITTSLSQLGAVQKVIQECQEAYLLIESHIKLAELSGKSPEAARAYAIDEASKRVPSVNLKPLLSDDSKDSTQKSRRAYKPPSERVGRYKLMATDLARYLDLPNVRDANLLLAERGFLLKITEGSYAKWTLTEKGKQFGMIIGSNRVDPNTGRSTQVIRWSEHIINAIKHDRYAAAH